MSLTYNIIMSFYHRFCTYVGSPWTRVILYDACPRRYLHNINDATAHEDLECVLMLRQTRGYMLMVAWLASCNFFLALMVFRTYSS